MRREWNHSWRYLKRSIMRTADLHGNRLSPGQLTKRDISARNSCIFAVFIYYTMLLICRRLVLRWPVLGEFEQLVLLALMRLGNGAFGAAIHREIVTSTGRDLPASSVYVTLDRLEGKRMVCSYTGTPTHAARRKTTQTLSARHRRPARPRPSVAHVCGDDRRHPAGTRITICSAAAGHRHGESARTPAGGRWAAIRSE